MRIDTYGQQIDITPPLSDYVQNKLSRLERHFDHHPIEAKVQLRVDKPQHCAEATINLAGGRVFHADASGQDMYAAIDLLADKLDRLLMKHKDKVVDHHRGESAARKGDFA